MMRKSLVCLGVLLAVLLVGFGAVAQEAATAAPVPAPDAATETAFNLQEGAFALMVLAIVMGGLIGFEYIQRRKRSL